MPWGGSSLLIVVDADWNYDEDGVEKQGVEFDFVPTAEVAAEYLDQ